jgi:eukaryotic-like serine/threonine-protein kinase
MPGMLKVQAGQFSAAGVKPSNDDSCGIRIPEGLLLETKGVAAVIADGMTGSEAGREAAEVCVLGFLSDYYSTPDSWSVKKSAGKVLTALNHWLCGQGRRVHGSSRGMVTTMSALVIKSATAYLFHVGDTRIYLYRKGDLECLTNDHRMIVSKDSRYLARAMGIDVHLAIDWRAVPVEPGDLFLLSTDGVHDFLSRDDLKGRLNGMDNPEQAVRDIVEHARRLGSDDNLTCQVIRVDRLPTQDKLDLYERLTELPFPPPLEPGMVMDGLRVLRELHASRRTQVYLAEDAATGREVVLKTPSVNYEDDPEYIDRFLHEEWVGKRLDSPHILKVIEPSHPRRFLYYVTEKVEGRTLRQWRVDHPSPTLSRVRDIVNQIAAGLRVFHRMEMVHRDLKPENIMIDEHGTVRIIDFGSSRIPGIDEIAVPWERNHLVGTRNYTAPECVRGESGTEQSDLFSLGVIAYELLTGHLPYGREESPRDPGRVPYTPARRFRPEIPAWVDGALEKTVRPDPRRRYEVISEFVHDLSNPNPAFLTQNPTPLIERDPLRFWRTAALALLILNFLLLLYFLAVRT